MILIECQDCIPFLNKQLRGSVELAVIDPPYNLKIADWDTFVSHEAFLEFTRKWIDSLIPALSHSASLYIFNTPFNCAYILPCLIDKGMIFRNWITWNKRDGLSTAKRKYVNSQETILYFTKSDDHTFNYDDIREPYLNPPRRLGTIKTNRTNGISRWHQNPKGKLCDEVWHFSSAKYHNMVHGKTKKLMHKTSKPYAMIERIIKASSNKGDRVLDCFVGTGTTAMVCRDLGRDFVGCDNNLDYVDLTKTRLETGRIATQTDKGQESLI